MHANDEQLEAILQGWQAQDEHICTCEGCRCRLEQMRQTRDRLQKAFACTCGCASDELKGRVQAALQKQSTQHRVRKLLASHPLVRKLVPVIVAAAAVLILAIPAAIYFGSPSQAAAAPVAARELASIHAANLTDSHEGHDFVASDDPAALAAHFREHLGFEPALPKSGQGLAMRSCCVSHFRGKAVGSYVVNTPKGMVSVIVVPDTPQAMGFCDKRSQSGQTFYTCQFASNHLAMVRLGQYSYCAVGELDHQHLIDLLDKLVR